MRRNTVSQLCLMLLLLAAGVLIVAQLRAQRRLRTLTLGQDDQAILLSELIDANLALQAEVESLRAQTSVYEDENRGTVLEELVAELNRVRVINGMVEVSGPGVEFVIDGSLSALDLQDLINELRNAGAEAIALNGCRVVLSSVLTVDDHGEPTIDGQDVGQPYALQAIGDSETIETAMIRPGGLVSILRHTYPNLVVQATQHPKLVLGQSRAPMAFQYARSVE